MPIIRCVRKNRKKLIKAVKKMDRYGREEMITLDKEEFKMYSLYFREEQEKH